MLSISHVADATHEEWDTLWRNCESATYYHSREWADIWESYSDGAIRAFPKSIVFSDDLKVVLPVMRRTYFKGLVTRFALTGPPFLSKYGNWLCTSPLQDRYIGLLSSYILNRYRNLTWQLNPFDPDSKSIDCCSGFTIRYPEVTYSIDLTKGEEAIYKKIKTSCKNHIKQGINNGLIISEGSGIEHWKQYYEIYRDTVRRWGTKAPYFLGWKLFEILYRKNSPHIKLWLVWHQRMPIAGCVNFYSNGKIMAWHMASLTAYRHLRPVHLLEYSMILDGLRNSYLWYDLGTDAGNKGLQDFKRSFGPEKLMCDKIVSWHPIISRLLRAREKIRQVQ